MKTVKLVLGIVSMVLCIVIMLQSCAAGIGNTLSENGEVSGTAGFLLAICIVIAGIIGVTTRNSGKGGAYTAGGFYLVGGVIGFITAGSYTDLYIWSTIAVIFGIVFIIGTIFSSKKNG